MNEPHIIPTKHVYIIDSTGILWGTGDVTAEEYNPECHITIPPPSAPDRELYDVVWNKETKKWSIILSVRGEQFAWGRIRQIRSELLAATDWTQVADVALSKEKKAAVDNYRQQLRDITSKFANPAEVVWPTNPLD